MKAFDFDREEFRQTGLLKSPELGSEEAFTRRETVPTILRYPLRQEKSSEGGRSLTPEELAELQRLMSNE